MMSDATIQAAFPTADEAILADRLRGHALVTVVAAADAIAGRVRYAPAFGIPA